MLAEEVQVRKYSFLLFFLGVRKMKRMKWVASVLLIVPVLLATPALADAHWHGGGGLFWGFGAGLLSGYLLAPRPVYVAPAPVYAAPPPAVEYAPPPATYYSAPPPAPVPQPETAQLAPAPPPGNQSMCREWKMIESRTDYQWDSYYGRYRAVPVQRWGWVEIPCK